MKKEILCLLVASVLCICSAKADDIVINDVEVPQGGTVSLPVGYSFTSTTEKVGFTFSLSLPDGLSLVEDADGDPVYDKDASISKLNVIATGVNVAGQPSSGTSAISGTSGTLLTLKLSADNSLDIGSEHVVTVSKCTFQQRADGAVTDINMPDFTFKVTIAAPDDGRVKFDENAVTLPAYTVGAKADITMRRTIKAGVWSTLCLPFGMTEAQVKAAFGSDVQLAEYIEHEMNDKGTDITVYCDYALIAEDGLMANYPYLIRTTKDITEFTADGVTIDPDEEGAIAEFTNGRSGSRKEVYGTFRGTYHAQTVVPENCLFLSGNEFWYSNGETTIKAFRAYFDFVDVLASVEDVQSHIILYVGNETTGIQTVHRKSVNSEYHDLQGRRVSKPAKGIYLRDGRKVVVK